MKIIKYLVFLMLLSSPSFAADHFVWDEAPGPTHDGTSWTSAWTDLPSSFVRGDTYYVAGGSYGGHDFDTTANGQTISIIKASAISACTEADGWQAAFATDQAVFSATLTIDTSDWLFDGVTGGGPGSWDSGHGIAFKDGSALHLVILATDNAIDNIVFRHIEFTNEAGPEDGGQDQDQIYSFEGVDDIEISYCYLHDCPCDFMQVGHDWDTMLFEYNYVENGWIGSSEDCHPDVFEYGVRVGTASNWTFRYNKFYNIAANYLWGAHANSTLSGVKIYGNLLQDVGCSNGIVSGLSSGGVITGMRFYNNTMVHNGYGARTKIGFEKFNGGTDNLAYNNIWYDSYVTPSISLATCGYNASDDTLSGSNNIEITGAVFSDYSGGDFTLSGTFPEGWGGTTLSDPYDYDRLSDPAVERGADGVWDYGAYEYDEGGVTEPATISRGTLQRGIRTGFSD